MNGIGDYLPSLGGSISVVVLAILLVVPFSLSVALFAGEYYRGTRRAKWVKYILDLSKHIPSIIWGMTGYCLFRKTGIFPTAVVLAAMIIPYASASLLSCIIRVPTHLREGAYNLGATTTDMIRNVILPYAKNGMMAAYLLAAGKALGETVIVILLAGNTLTSAILHQSQIQENKDLLFVLILTLFLVSGIINWLAEFLIQKTV